MPLIMASSCRYAGHVGCALARVRGTLGAKACAKAYPTHTLHDYERRAPYASNRRLALSIALVTSIMFTLASYDRDASSALTNSIVGSMFG